MNDPAVKLLIPVLACAVAYMTYLYLKTQWHTAELLLTFIGGSVFPAMMAQVWRQRSFDDSESYVYVAMIVIVSQMFAMTGTLMAAQWIRTWKITSTARRLGITLYAWTVLPALLLFGISPLAMGVVLKFRSASPAENDRAFVILAMIFAITFIILRAARRLQRGPQE
jgi:hypothetical protein